jgi:hypothetical protein
MRGRPVIGEVLTAYCVNALSDRKGDPSMRFRSFLSLTAPALLCAVLATASAASERAGIAIRLAANEADLPQGEFACYGADGRIMIGLGFRVLPGRKYVTLDNTEGGTYVYDVGAATITFVGGFLEGFVGQDVVNNKFHIHSASCGPF